MTTKELLQKAENIVSKSLDVLSIQVQIGKENFQQWKYEMRILVFYKIGQEESNFSIMLTDWNKENYSVEKLLTELDKEAKKIHKRYFKQPDPKTKQTTDLTIEL